LNRYSKKSLTVVLLQCTTSIERKSEKCNNYVIGNYSHSRVNVTLIDVCGHSVDYLNIDEGLYD